MENFEAQIENPYESELIDLKNEVKNNINSSLEKNKTSEYRVKTDISKLDDKNKALVNRFVVNLNNKNRSILNTINGPSSRCGLGNLVTVEDKDGKTLTTKNIESIVAYYPEATSNQINGLKKLFNENPGFSVLLNEFLFKRATKENSAIINSIKTTIKAFAEEVGVLYITKGPGKSATCLDSAVFAINRSLPNVEDKVTANIDDKKINQNSSMSLSGPGAGVGIDLSNGDKNRIIIDKYYNNHKDQIEIWNIGLATLVNKEISNIDAIFSKDSLNNLNNKLTGDNITKIQCSYPSSLNTTKNIIEDFIKQRTNKEVTFIEDNNIKTPVINIIREVDGKQIDQKISFDFLEENKIIDNFSKTSIQEKIKPFTENGNKITSIKINGSASHKPTEYISPKDIKYPENMILTSTTGSINNINLAKDRAYAIYDAVPVDLKKSISSITYGVEGPEKTTDDEYQKHQNSSIDITYTTKDNKEEKVNLELAKGSKNTTYTRVNIDITIRGSGVYAKTIENAITPKESNKIEKDNITAK